jgi:hypothetical protein
VARVKIGFIQVCLELKIIRETGANGRDVFWGLIWYLKNSPA